MSYSIPFDWYYPDAAAGKLPCAWYVYADGRWFTVRLFSC